MHAQGRSRFARLAAPLALIAVALALVLIVLGSGVLGEDEAGEQAGATGVPAAGEQQETAPARPKGPRTYTIEANDTLSGIAEQHGTTVERLQELNPELDPQGLVAGQKIKLRE